MPRVDLTLWDRIYILKLISTVQMTFASFVTILYLYLIVLQSWSSFEDKRPGIMEYKWSVLVMTMVDFGMGTLLAFAANMKGIRGRRRIVTWIILEILLIPSSIFLLMKLYYKIPNAKKSLSTDPHYTRINIAQVCFLCCHFLFIAYAIDFLVHRQKKTKTYDPSIRPESVYAPTDPQITTTESRHINMSQSFLFQPSTSKRLNENVNEEKEEADTENNE